MGDYRKTEISGSAVIVGAVIVGVTAIAAAYKSRALDRVKYSAKRGIRATNLEAFDKADQGKVRKIARKYLRKVEQSRSKDSAMAAREAFEEAVAQVGTSARKLADEKMDALGDVYNYAMDKCGDPGSDRIKNAVGQYAHRIEKAATRENVREIRKEFMSWVNSARKRR